MSGIKKSAKHGKFIIELTENDTVSIIFDNTRQGLRDIADEMEMEYDPDWNTRYFGHRLINFINGVDTTRKNKEVEESDSNTYSISDADWEWWVGLSDAMKYEILCNIRGDSQLLANLRPQFDTFKNEIFSEKIDLYNRKSLMARLLSRCILNNNSEEGFDCNWEEFTFGLKKTFISDLHKLAYIKRLTAIDYTTRDIPITEKEIDMFAQIPQIEKLELGVNKIELQAWPKLSSLSNLKELNLQGCQIKFTSDDIANLKLPNCSIEWKYEWE